MANVASQPTFFPRRINDYVPAMQYSADVNYNGVTRVNFGAPIAGNPTLIVNAQSLAAVGSIDISSVQSYLPYGRNLTIVASGAATVPITIRGQDYLGQPMVEIITLNGVTTVQGNKAFFSGISISWSTTAAVTFNVGNGTQLGLPYKTIRAVWETVNGVVGTLGTLQPAFLGVQTATTNDPRGLYIPAGAVNGTNIITAAFDMVNDVDSANVGGLHGNRHFFS